MCRQTTERCWSRRATEWCGPIHFSKSSLLGLMGNHFGKQFLPHFLNVLFSRMIFVSSNTSFSCSRSERVRVRREIKRVKYNMGFHSLCGNFRAMLTKSSSTTWNMQGRGLSSTVWESQNCWVLQTLDFDGMKENIHRFHVLFYFHSSLLVSRFVSVAI